MNSFLSFGLIALMLFITPVHRAMAQSLPSDNLRRQVIEWGTNKPIAIQLKSGAKLQGRIAEIKDDALLLQLLEQGKIETRALQWGEIKKVSLKNSADEKARKIGGFIALGTIAAVVIIIGVALSDPNF